VSNLPVPKDETLSSLLGWVYALARTVVSEYLTRSYRPTEMPRSADDLCNVIKERCSSDLDLQISFQLLPESPKLKDAVVFGILIRSNSDAKIYINPHVSNDAKRLVIVKECFQAMLDSQVSDQRNIHRALGHTWHRAKHRAESPDAFSSVGEHLAEIAAMEALFPYAFRLECKRLEVEAKTDPSTIIHRASKRFAIPPDWVRFYLQDEIMELLAPYAEQDPGHTKTEKRPKKSMRRPSKA